MPIAEPKTFASVLSEHMYSKKLTWQIGGAMTQCECGDNIYVSLKITPAEAIARHLEAKLIEAGFNPIPEPVEPKEPHLDPETCWNRDGRMVCPSICWGC